MAASTRADILATARELFTRYGYHHVSMRSISDAMGISVGNLTYHFPRKADLADALLEQELQRVLMAPRPGLDALDQCLRGMLSSLLENARLFSDAAMFLSIPALAHGHRDRVARLRAMLRAMLQAQADAGLLDPGEQGPATLDDLTDLLMYCHLGWQQQMALLSLPPHQALEQAMGLQWTALRPWLTPAGLASLGQLPRSD